MKAVRRCGKSTLARQIINHLVGEKKVIPRNTLFLNLGHPGFSRYRSDPAYLERMDEDDLKLASPEGRVYPFSFGEFMKARGADYQDPVSLVRHRHEIRRLTDDYLRDDARSIPHQDIAARFGVKKPVEAMDETDVKHGVIVTSEDEEEIRKGTQTVSAVPAYKFSCQPEARGELALHGKR